MKSLVLFFVLLVFASLAWSLDQTPTGFYYPTGTSNLGSYAGWLASNCNGNDDYLPNLYHIGYDIQASLNDPVYAINDGEIVSISENGWGTGNVGIMVKHQLSGGNFFLALYGHVRTSLDEGDDVYAGKSFASIGPWDGADHLHFGIVPSSAIPGTNSGEGIGWGRMTCDNWPSTNTFVDPINWITTMYPKVATANVGEFPPGEPNANITAKMIQAYNLALSGGTNLGIPFDNGGGPYVHKYYGYWVQDLRNTSTGLYCILVYNPDENEVFGIIGGIREFVFANNWIRDHGVPITWEISAEYKYVPYYGATVMSSRTVTVQIFRIGTNLSTRTTVVYEPSNGTTSNHAVGRISLTGAPGYKWYMKQAGSADNYKLLFTIGSTGKEMAWVDAGPYLLKLEDANGNTALSENNTPINGIAHTVYEGNNQLVDPGIPEPEPAGFDISPSSLSFTKPANNKIIQITTNAAWNVVKPAGCDWLSFSRVTGAGDDELIIHIIWSKLGLGTKETDITFGYAKDYAQTVTCRITTIVAGTGLYPPQVIKVEELHYDYLILAWEDPGNPAGTCYKVYKDGVFKEGIDGLKYWDHGITNGESYSYQIEAFLGPDISAKSEPFIFDMPNYYITVLSPNGGELFNIGQNLIVQWESFIPDPNVAVYLSQDGGNWIGFGAPEASAQEYFWKLPQFLPLSNNCLVKVCGADHPEIFDVSDAVFSIVDLSLPVNLSSFTAHQVEEVILIQWTTASEESTLHFSIERSVDQNTWQEIGRVFGQGTSSREINYEFTDKNPIPGKSYYRLIEISTGGNRTTYHFISVNFINAPTDYALYQNYPNPFNPSTIIAYSLAEEGRVVLSIYNTKGQLIETLVNQNQPPGNYEVRFKASNLPTGIYFYQLKTKKFTDTKKMIFTK